MKKDAQKAQFPVKMRRRKLLMLMKLASVFLFMIIFQAKAHFSEGQKISVDFKNTEIREILVAIEKETPYRFIYSPDIASLNNTVTIDIKNKGIDFVLAALLGGSGLNFQKLNDELIAIVGNAILEKKISGKITNEKDEPLSGVSVVEKGTKNGTVSNADGDYSLTVADDRAVIVFSFVGYNAIEVEVGSELVHNVSLKSIIKQGDEVVVVGYGTARKKDLTGSITSVRGEELAKQPAANPISSLQGKVSGLTISNSGKAGEAPVVRIRGVNSTNSASPVYVVDGILQDDINYLNPADIESIDVLKDPSSIAIYGVRGANGVIAVTTKKASRGQTRVNLQSTVGQQVVQDRIAVTNAEEFLRLKKILEENSRIATDKRLDAKNFTANTDWQDVIFQKALLTTNNLSISNSGDKTTSYLNVGYTNQDGVIKNDQYERYLVRLNEEIRITKQIKVGAEVTGYHYVFTPQGTSVTNAIWALPIVPVQKDENTYYSMPNYLDPNLSNPMANINTRKGNEINRGYRFVGNIFAEIKFLKNFAWKSALYMDMSLFSQRRYGPLPFKFIHLAEGASVENTTFNHLARTSIAQQQNIGKRVQQDHTLTFDKNLGNKASINVLAGVTALKGERSSVDAFRKDTILNIPDDPNLWYVNIVNKENPLENGGSGSVNSILGSFLRVSTNFYGKYLLNATIRRDGSSKFAPENRWGTFGSVGLGWILSDEDFFANVNGISFLKLRAAWGLTGNANGFDDFLYVPGIQTSSTAIFGDKVYSSIQTQYIPDPNLHWETVRGIDLGIDLRALDNKLNFEFTYYDRTTTDIITQITIPNESRKYVTNFGEISNKGIEVSAGYKEDFGKDFNIGISGNFSYNVNKVVSIGDKINFEIFGNGGVNKTTSGQSIGYFYGYTQTGVYQSVADLSKSSSFPNSLPGDISYLDLNGDGVITSNDRGYLGSPFPPYSFGGAINIGFKNFDFAIEGQGSAGHKIYLERIVSSKFNTLNFESNRLQAWSGAGSTNIEPILNDTRDNNSLVSTYYLEPGDFFRLRNLQIGYNFSKQLLEKAKIRVARIYLNAQNLKTWSKVTGYSPEPIIGSILGGGADDGRYPIPAIYSVGLSLTF